VPDPDLRLEQARPLAGWTPAWFRQAVFTKHETTVLASRRDHFNVMSCGDSGSQRVTKILFHVAATETHLPGDRRH